MEDRDRTALQAVEERGRQEQGLLANSVAATLAIAALGLVFGLLTGSFAILFDGVYAVIDATMGAMALGVARLIARDALKRDDAAPARLRYQYGFCHLEPMVLALSAMLLTLATGYALVSAVMLIFEGGIEVDFDLAIPYAVIVVLVCLAMAWRQRRRNRALGSAFVALDARSWLMSGSITLALLLGFLVARVLERSALAWTLPYVDPVVLALVCCVVLPLPLADLRAAVAGVLRVAPEALDRHVRQVAAAAVARHGFVDAYSYVARVGRSTLIEIHFVAPPGWAISGLADLGVIRRRVGGDLGGEGPDRWLTISFTENPAWAF